MHIALVFVIWGLVRWKSRSLRWIPLNPYGAESVVGHPYVVTFLAVDDDCVQSLRRNGLVLHDCN